LTKFIIEYWPEGATGTSVKRDGTMWIVEAEDATDAVRVALLSGLPVGARIEKAWALANKVNEPKEMSSAP
jgi:hypothetical protein